MGNMTQFPSEARNVEGYLALPEQGEGPGVLVLHAWWGLNDFFKNFCNQLAREGFVAFAPDLYGGPVAATIEEAEKLLNSLDYREAIKDVVSSTDYLLAHPAVRGNSIGVIGFSMGASYATWLATLKPEVRAVVLFYGGVDEPDYATQTDADFLAHFAEDDDYESAEMVERFEQQLRTEGREVAFHAYPGTKHWFFENDRLDAYHVPSARLAWERTVNFLKRKLAL